MALYNTIIKKIVQKKNSYYQNFPKNSFSSNKKSVISNYICTEYYTALLNYLIKFKLNLDFHPLTPGEPLRYNPLVYTGELQGYDITSNNSLKK